MIKLLLFFVLFSNLYAAQFMGEKPLAWNFYGDGIGKSAKVTDVYLSTDHSENITSFVRDLDFENGNYKISFKISAKDVYKGLDGYSIWHFLDSGNGEETIFSDMYGSYVDKEVSYTTTVTNKKLIIWFRLKSIGQVWIKDFKIEKAQALIASVAISSGKTLSFQKKSTESLINKNNEVKDFKLLDFDTDKNSKPFTVKRDVKGNNIGTFSAHKYIDFDLNSLPLNNWDGFDRLSFDVYNPNANFITFSLAITDEHTTDYWTQLNYNEVLAPGWNKISFNLKQFVGERGSIKIFRNLNLAKIKKIFLAIDPERRIDFKFNEFSVDNIYLNKVKKITVPKEVMAFDFTSTRAIGSFIPKVTTQDLFNVSSGYGFLNSSFWKIEDSVYLSELDRHTIGILKGKFKVLVPNGKYKVLLGVNKLGYWDIPFFSDRTIFINNRPVFKESRINSESFLSDILQFEKVVPTLNDSPYDLYLNKIIKPIEAEVLVNNAAIEFDFKGDESAISLNSLILYNMNDTKVGSDFVKAVDDYRKREFSYISRLLINLHVSKSNTDLPLVSVVDSSLTFSSRVLNEKISDKIVFNNFSNERKFVYLQVKPQNKKLSLRIDVEKLKKNIDSHFNIKNLKIYRVINQFISPDLNHETYFLGGKFLKLISTPSIELNKDEVTFLAIEYSHLMFASALKTSALLNFSTNEVSQDLEIQFNLSNEALPSLDFPVGFMGLDPLPYSYYRGNGYEKLRRKYRLLALDDLLQSGFTSFSGLPEAKLVYENNKMKVDFSEVQEVIDRLPKNSMKFPLFTYGGQFPDTLFRRINLPNFISEETYFRALAPELNDFFLKNKNTPLIYLFSDEAGGYLSKTEEDYNFGTKIHKYFPKLSLGGFGFYFKDQETKLNDLFDYGFFSKLSTEDITHIKSKSNLWGMYNGAALNIDDPRFSFGLGLYVARQAGMSYYLEWNSIGFHNYPYYDLDGRESDVANFYPTIDGSLSPSIKYTMAISGLNYYRKLKLLELKIGRLEVSNPLKAEALAFIQNLLKDGDISKTKLFMTNKNHKFAQSEMILDSLLSKFPVKK